MMQNQKFTVLKSNTYLIIDFWDTKDFYLSFLFTGLFYFSIALIFFNYMNLLISCSYTLLIGYFYYKFTFDSSQHLILKIDKENDQLTYSSGKNQVIIHIFPCSKVTKVEFLNAKDESLELDTVQSQSSEHKENTTPFKLRFYFNEQNSFELGLFRPLAMLDIKIIKFNIEKLLL